MRNPLNLLLILGILMLATPALPAAPAAPAAAVTALSPSERADLALLGSQNEGLLKQSAGELVLVEQDNRRWHRGYSYGLGGLILTSLIVVLIVVSQPTPRRY